MKTYINAKKNKCSVVKYIFIFIGVWICQMTDLATHFLENQSEILNVEGSNDIELCIQYA